MKTEQWGKEEEGTGKTGPGSLWGFLAGVLGSLPASLSPWGPSWVQPTLLCPQPASSSHPRPAKPSQAFLAPAWRPEERGCQLKDVWDVPDVGIRLVTSERVEASALHPHLLLSSSGRGL